MELKYTGQTKRLKIRGVEFPIDEVVKVNDPLLAEKMSAWPDVEVIETLDGENASNQE